MTSKRSKLIALIIISIALFSLCLLAYENVVLRSNVALLHNRYEHLIREYEVLQNNYSTLVKSFEALSFNYIELTSDYAKLSNAYAVLNTTYNALLQNYTILQQQLQGYFELQSRYEELLSEHQALLVSLAKLREAYEKLRFAVYHPLWSNETVRPTIKDLQKWLAEDDTDKIPYSKWDFVCGDYALMLSVKAKMNCWDMGVVVVLGRDAQGNNFSHAFNAIKCVEGLVYVEPQNDQVFYGPIRERAWYYHPGFGQIYVESFVVVVPYEI